VTDGLLFTHQGLSGPAALRISSRWRRGEALCIDLAPHTDVPAFLRAPGRGKALARTALAELLPRRLAEAVAAALPTGLADRRLAELARADLDALARAEAASGGLNTAAFSAKTMQCRAIPGQFAVGEALDIAGDLGGHNLHWDWASGFAAGQAV
jgi:predicted flavoprotein YhiN